MSSVQLSAVSFQQNERKGAKAQRRKAPTRPVPSFFASLRLCVFAFLLLFPPQVRAESVRLDADLAAARVVEVSPLRAAAAQRAAAAGAAVQSADAVALPLLTATASASQRSSVPELALPLGGPGQPPLVLVPDITTTGAAGLGVRQPLYAGGAIRSGRAAARAEASAAEAAEAQTVVDLRLQARLAYWEAVRSRASLELARAQERRSARLLEDTRALLDAGMAVRADLLAAEERVASARVAVIGAETAAANAEERLRSLLNFAPEDTFELADSLVGPLPGSPPAAAALEQDALARRPELVATAARIAALAALESVARAPSRPSLGATAQWDYAEPNQRYFPPAKEWNDSWAVALVGSWTVFDGGKWRADVAAAQASTRAAEADRAELERGVRLEVGTARRELDSALAAVAAADAARAAADEREKEARERHAAGLAAMAEILDAEEQLASSEQRQVNTRAAAWVAAARLERAVGR